MKLLCHKIIFTLIFFIFEINQSYAQEDLSLELILKNDISILQQKNRNLEIASSRVQASINFLRDESNFRKVESFDEEERERIIDFINRNISQDNSSIDDITEEDAVSLINLFVDYWSNTNISTRIDEAQGYPENVIGVINQSVDDVLLTQMVSDFRKTGTEVYEKYKLSFESANPKLSEIMSDSGFYPDLYSYLNSSFTPSRYKLISNFDALNYFLSKDSSYLDNNFSEYFSEASKQIILTKIRKLEEMYSYISDLKQKISLDISDKATTLVSIDNNERDIKAQIDEKLVYAVYMMIAALLILFLIISRANETIVSDIISSRSLVESVGIAFLLITIIILGTGEKVEETTLGTLLGTIAGYIFGSGVSRSSNRKND